jgi:hypothetical protein
VKITNLAKQVGEVRTLYGGRGHGSRDILCMECHVARTEGLKERLYGR